MLISGDRLIGNIVGNGNGSVFSDQNILVKVFDRRVFGRCLTDKMTRFIHTSAWLHLRNVGMTLKNTIAASPRAAPGVMITNPAACI